MFCTILQWLIAHALTDTVRAHLQAAYDAHCGGTVHTDDGGGGGDGPPPKD